ncbi:hypothetical protein [Gulosibacter sediminis]|nr:hypothetical protein [Gulosibacter sediminis]
MILGMDGLAAGAGEAASAVSWWIGGIVVAVIFGAMVWRTVRRNRMKKKK